MDDIDISMITQQQQQSSPRSRETTTRKIQSTTRMRDNMKSVTHSANSVFVLHILFLEKKKNERQESVAGVQERSQGVSSLELEDDDEVEENDDDDGE